MRCYALPTTGLGVLLPVLLLAAPAGASHMTTLSSVDFIDAIFPSGGGSYTKSLTSGADDGWSVFAANVGDVVTVTFSATAGTSGAFAAYDGAALFETTDGIVSIGDQVNVTDFSFNRFLAGTDLVIQHPGFNPDSTGSYQFDSSISRSVSFTAGSTGQYAVGVSCSDESCVNGSTFTVQVSGNTAAIPEPSTAALLGLGLLGIAAHRYRAATSPSS